MSSLRDRRSVLVILALATTLFLSACSEGSDVDLTGIETYGIDYDGTIDPDNVFVEPLADFPTGNTQAEFGYLAFISTTPIQGDLGYLDIEGTEDAWVALGYDFCVDFDEATNWMTYTFQIKSEVTAKVGIAAISFLCI